MSQASQSADLVGFPASVIQKYFWDLDTCQPGNPVLNVAVRFHLAGELNVPLLERTFNQIIQRHEILRSVLRAEHNGLLQIIVPEFSIAVPCLDLRNLVEEQRQAEIERLSIEEAQKPFNVAELPLIRATILRAGDAEHLLLITAHHAVIDGWSIGLITNELAAIYPALKLGKTPSVLPLSVQYGDYAVWQGETLSPAKVSEHMMYWTLKLAGLEPLVVSPDRPRAIDITAPANIISLVLPRELTDRLQQLAVASNTTYFVIVLAAFKLLLRLYTNRSDINVGTQMAGRESVELENLIGAFINTVVLRTELTDGLTFRELLKNVGQTVVESFAHEELPYPILLRDLQPEWPRDPKPLFHVNFICQRDFVRPVQFGGISLTAVPSKSQGALYDLNFFWVERADGWRLSCEYNTNLYDESTARRMLDDYRKLLDALAQDPGLQLPEYAGFILGRGSRAGIVEATAGPSQVGEQGRASSGVESYAFPLSLSQRRFWMMDQLHPNNPMLNVPANLHVKGPLDVEVLNRCFLELIRRHELLRTRVYLEDNEPMQEVVSQVNFLMHQLDLGNLSKVEQEHKSSVHMREAGAQGFDLSVAPLINVTLLRLAPDDHILNVTMPHIICDGWSSGILFRELRTLYKDLSSGESSLEPVTLQYGDYAVWQQEFLRSEPFKSELYFWKEKLSGSLPILDVPVDRSPMPGKISPAEHRSLQLSPQFASRFKEFCKQEGVTAFMGLLAAFQCLLHRYSDGTDILIGSPSFNRNSQTEKIFGPFANPICLRAAVEGEMTFRELLKNARETTLSALEKDIPFEQLMEEVDAKPTAGRHPLFQYYFYYQVAFLQSFEAAGLTFAPIATGVAGAAAEIQLSVIDRGGTLSANVDYNADLYDAATIRAFLQHYRRVLEVVVESPGLRIKDVPIVNEAEAKAESDVLTAALLGKRTITIRAAETAGRPFAVPRTRAEWKIADIWKPILGMDSVSIDANFFDELGGTSLQALTIMTEIGHVFGQRLSPNKFFQAPTIREMAGLVGDPVNKGPLSLVAIHPHGSAPPLFWIPGGIGISVLAFRHLAQLLGPGQPSYGLEFNLSDEREPEAIEKRAAQCIELMRSVQPAGPYGVVGFCLGGGIALEIAQQLKRMGEKIYFLGLINSYFPQEPTFSQDLSRKMQRFVYVWKHPPSPRAVLLRKVAAGGARFLFEFAKDSMKGRARRLHESTQMQVATDAGLEEKNARIMNQYRPCLYSGRILLFLSADSIYTGVNPELDRRLMWKQLAASGCEIHYFTGDHVSILEHPAVRSMAEVFSRELANVCEEAALETQNNGTG